MIARIILGQRHDRPVPEVKRIGNRAEKQEEPGCQQPVHQILVLAVGDHQHRPRHGQKRQRAGKGLSGFEHGDGRCNQRQANPADRAVYLPAKARLAPEDRQKHSGQQLPGPEGEQVEGRGMRLPGRHDAGCQRNHRKRQKQPRQDPPRTRQDNHKQGDEDIELLFDRQRPGVQQHTLFAQNVEIPGAEPEEDVRQIDRGRDQFLAEFAEFEGQKDEPACDQAAEGHHVIGRRQPSNPAQEEPAQPQPTGFAQFTPEDTADQKA